MRWGPCVLCVESRADKFVWTGWFSRLDGPSNRGRYGTVRGSREDREDARSRKMWRPNTRAKHVV